MQPSYTDKMISGWWTKGNTEPKVGSHAIKDSIIKVTNPVFLIGIDGGIAVSQDGTITIPAGLVMNVPKFTSGHEPEGPAYVATEITAALDSATSIRESDPDTAEVTLTLRTIAINLQIQRKHIGYNVAPAAVESYLREDIVKNLTEREEDVIVNGDTDVTSANINNAYDATNHPHGYGATTNQWLIMQEGIRNSATGTAVDAGGDAIATTDFTSAFKNQGKYGVDPNESLILVSMDLFQGMQDMTELLTLDKYGPRATVLTGEVAKYKGRAVIVTDKMPSTQMDTLTNSGGIRSSSTATNTLTEATVVWKGAPMIGVPALADNALNVAIYLRPDLDRRHWIAREDFALAFTYPEAIVRIINILP